MSDYENVTPVPLKPRPIQDRLTVVLRVHHQYKMEQAVMAGGGYDDMLETSHEAYARRLQADEQWSEFDFGWIPNKDVGIVVVENLAGKNLQLNPTEEQRKLIADQVLEVKHAGDSIPLLIPPRAPQAIYSPRPWLLRIRCQAKPTRYKITVLPR